MLLFDSRFSCLQSLMENYGYIKRKRISGLLYSSQSCHYWAGIGWRVLFARLFIC